MGGGEGGRVTVRFPILGPLGISFGAPDGAQRPVISAISPTGLAAEVPGLRPGLVLVSVQGEPTDRGFDHAIAAIKESPRPLELVFAPADDADDASFRSAGSGGRTELMASALEGREATAAALRSQPEIDAQDDEGWTALHHACGAGQLGSIEELLRAGCAIDIEDSIGETAADVAEGAGHSDVVSLLQKCDVAAAAAGAPPDGAGHQQQELRHAKEQVAELTQALATERRCLQTLRDQAQVGRDGALASLLEELELAKTQLHTARQQQREAEDALQDERASGSSKAERDELRQRLCAIRASQYAGWLAVVLNRVAVSQAAGGAVSVGHGGRGGERCQARGGLRTEAGSGGGRGDAGQGRAGQAGGQVPRAGNKAAAAAAKDVGGERGRITGRGTCRRGGRGGERGRLGSPGSGASRNDRYAIAEAARAEPAACGAPSEQGQRERAG